MAKLGVLVNASIRNLLATISLVGFLPMRGQATVGGAAATQGDPETDWRERRAGMLRERDADLAALRAEIEGLLRSSTPDD